MDGKENLPKDGKVRKVWAAGGIKVSLIRDHDIDFSVFEKKLLLINCGEKSKAKGKDH